MFSLSHKKVPSISLTRDDVARGRTGTDTESSTGSGLMSRSRSLSPFHRRSSSRSKSQAQGPSRDSSVEGLRVVGGVGGGEGDGESDWESRVPTARPNNSFNDSSSDESESDLSNDEHEGEGEEGAELSRNTELNSVRVASHLGNPVSTSMIFDGEGPNLLREDEIVRPKAGNGTVRPGGRLPPRRRASTKSRLVLPVPLITSRPIFERNRCTITLTHGYPSHYRPTTPSTNDTASGASLNTNSRKRVRNYIVASDLSTESLYAIQWCIGTVLREGDECLLVSVMETDTKFDDDSQDKAAKMAKVTNQRERQANALVLVRQATALVERTRLNVTIQCQAIHAKNARHMLVDMIDYHEPTMVIIGTRGLSKIKGMLLGSVSNYLIQKSSSPVMVTRRPLRLARTVHKKLSSLNRDARVSLADAQIDKESKGGEIDQDPSEPVDIAELVQEMEISEK